MENEIKQRLKTLSARELEVLKLVCKNYTGKEIAYTLKIGISTVDTYKARIRKKIDVFDFRALCTTLDDFTK